MPFLQEVAPEILLVVLCINGMVGVGQILVPDIVLKTPFNGIANVTTEEIPQSLNRTNPNNLIANLTTNIQNSTSSNPFIALLQGSQFLLTFFQWTWVFVMFISGGFLWGALEAVGFPAVFTYLLEAIVVILLGRTIFYYVTGK